MEKYNKYDRPKVLSNSQKLLNDIVNIGSAVLIDSSSIVFGHGDSLSIEQNSYNLELIGWRYFERY